MKLVNYIRELSANGRCHFTSEEAKSALKISQKALNMALLRLRHKGLLASPAKQFYLIIPPEYMASGCLPPDHFIPHLMKYLGLPYYVCLLSAAEYYGAAHQKSQYFQIMTSINRPDIKCGQIQCRFIKKKVLKDTPVRMFNTPASVVSVSTPEVTAMDLMNYFWQSGGLNHVTTVLSELSESIDPHALAELISKSKETACLQRFGYFLDILGREELVIILQAELKNRKLAIVPLNSNMAMTGCVRDPKWRIAINMHIEGDV